MSDVPLGTDSGGSPVWGASLCCLRGQRRRLWFRPRGVVPVVAVLRLVLRGVAVVCILGAVLRVVVARGTPTRCGVCGSVCGTVAVVSVLWRGVVLFQVQPSLYSLSSGCPLPMGPGCAGRLRAAVGVPLGPCVGVLGLIPLCAVRRVFGAASVCVWCPPSVSIAGAVEVVGVAPRYVFVVRVLAILRAVVLLAVRSVARAL